MPETDLLIGIAEGSVALAGFSGLIGAIRASTADGWHPRDIWSLSWMLGASMGALLLALLPLWLALFEWSNGLAYRVSSTVSFLYIGTLVWGIRGQYHRKANLAAVRVEQAFPPIVDREIFDRVQAILRSRAPNVVPPGRVSSRYLLSGLLRCGRCHAAMFGAGAKSGQFHYYMCATAYRTGRSANARLRNATGYVLSLPEFQKQ